ncbi:hypothetical protein KQY27_06140 [Methanobrevibacter sp. TMH8]|uniref:hypothetical protein n=1 Tax=Methanobrevibacter sp. TMH8 TaxID=2848611 RepID=UPI001CCFF386|nr:hypothetical protein [Methanobrevibacter sp. TMH8]MBZ9571117.1 hypothetical protein [Methanobrevibacter sp. TMH8]
MKVSLIFGYIGVFLGFLFGFLHICTAFFFMNPIVIFGLLGFIVFPTIGLIAIKLDSKDTNMVSAMFLISSLGLIFTGFHYGIIIAVFFLISALLEFIEKNKVSFANTNQRNKWIIIQFIFILLIPLLYYIQSLFFIS